jgi:parallel beta-helix repeat protein
MKRHLLVLLTCLFFVLLLASPVSAADITSCGSVTEDSVLASDLTSTGTCLTIKADNIVLDCAGHSITGAGTGYGIYLNGRTGVTVKNCNIKNFYSGITIHWSSFINLTNNVVNGNSYFGIVLGNSHSNNLIHNTANTNRIGIYLHSSKHNILIDNNASDNSFHGIRPHYSNHNNLIGNIANNNNYAGIPMEYSDYNTLSSNVANNNRYYGISLLYSSVNTLTGNRVRGNGVNGIHLIQSSNNLIENNKANENGYRGIVLAHGSNDNKIIGNEANHHGFEPGREGILLVGKLNSNNVIKGNVIKGNKWGILLHHYKKDGVTYGSAFNTTIDGNIVSNFSYAGIAVWRASDKNTVVNNIVSDAYFPAGQPATGIGAASDNNYIARNLVKNSGGGIIIGGQLYSNYGNVVTENTMTENRHGLIIYSPAPNTIYHNNIYANTKWNVYSTVSIELSHKGEGNFWGHTCADPALFTPGVDSNRADVIDSYPYGALIDEDEDGIIGYQPGCPLVAIDNCPTRANPGQEDTDTDTFGDICDNCPTVPNPDQTDSDSDCIGNACDNCPFDYNPGQLDNDGDGLGDACDPDDDDDGLLDTEELEGWNITVYNCDGTVNYIYHVTSDPYQADVDSDNLNDLEEKEGWNVWYRVENPNPPPKFIWIEYHVSSNPNDTDWDNDNINDWWEKVWKADPNRNDTDCDSSWNTNDGFEIEYGLNATNYDTDDDGISDGEEIDLWIEALGYDPEQPELVPLEVLLQAISNTNNPVMPAFLDIDPDTLNLRSKGKWITAYIELPKGYEVADIDCSKIRLEDTILADSCDRPLESVIGDYDEDGILDLMVKFSRADVQLLLDSNEVELTVTGELYDGTPFKGFDVIRVIDKGQDSPNQGSKGKGK